MENKVIKVLELEPGEKGKVYKILHEHLDHHGSGHCQGRGCCKRCKMKLFKTLGLCEGEVLKVIKNGNSGPVILKGKKGWFFLEKDEAACILVNPIKKNGNTHT